MDEISSEMPMSAASLLVAAGRDRSAGAPLNQPIVPASNFNHGAERVYSRGDGTPTWEALEESVGALERGRAVAFSSGMAAVAAIFDQQPLDLGADFSLQSATKCIGGHSELLAGVVTVRREDLREALRRARVLNGATPGALEAFLAVRGARNSACGSNGRRPTR